MSEAPPSRYRVVERGRRLEVIDTLTGEPTRPRRASAEPPAPLPTGLARYWPRQTRFDGTAEVVTHRFYDAKAPRTITLDPATVDRLEWAKGAALVVAIAFVVGVAMVP